MWIPVNIDPQAPLSARKETVVHTPIDAVWSVLTDIECWPEWQPDVSSAKLEGDIGVGTVFRWRAKGMGITSTIQELEPQRRIGWSGRSLGVRALHFWTLESRGDETRIVTEESMSGWLVRILKVLSPGFLDQALSRSVEMLRARAERAPAVDGPVRSAADQPGRNASGS